MQNPEHAPTTTSRTTPSARPSRRHVLGSIAASTAAAAVPTLGFAPAAKASTGRGPEPVYIGTWQGTQVNAAWFDPDHGTLTPLGTAAQVNSSWQTPHPTEPILYVGSGDAGGTVSAFRSDRTSGALSLINRVVTDSAATPGGLSYIGIDPPSRTLLAANFAAGFTASLPLRHDGSLGPLVSTVADTGSGPNPRQQSPRPHHVAVAPNGRFALVADFGADRVFVHRFDRDTRGLSADPRAEQRAYATPPGSGPRRIQFHPDGRHLYLLNELTADLHVLDWNPRRETPLELRQSLSTDSPDFTGTKSGAELAVSGDGRFLYTSNRGENTLVVFATDPTTGRLTLIQRVPCGGVSPWSFSLHRSGRWLLVANRLSNTVDLFSIDRHTGKLTGTGTSIPVPGPDCVTFLPRASHAY
ncbi:lactonase family protein [Streptomyces sp. NPDC002577]